MALGKGRERERELCGIIRNGFRNFYYHEWNAVLKGESTARKLHFSGVTKKGGCKGGETIEKGKYKGRKGRKPRNNEGGCFG